MQDGVYRPRPSLLDSIFNFLTTLVLLTTIFMGGVFAAIYLNPQIFFNPFPPSDPPDQPIAPTEMVTQEIPTETPMATITPLPSPTLTPTEVPPTLAPAPTPLPYTKQPGTPAYTQNFLNDLACEWMGVAGQVILPTDWSGPDPWVHISGEFNGEPLDYIALPGSAPGYGDGGYEFRLGDGPVASEGLIWIQLEDPLGNPMADRVDITTTDQCSENLIIVNWVVVP